jgi:hypothetical protein
MSEKFENQADFSECGRSDTTGQIVTALLVGSLLLGLVSACSGATAGMMAYPSIKDAKERRGFPRISAKDSTSETDEIPLYSELETRKLINLPPTERAGYVYIIWGDGEIPVLSMDVQLNEHVTLPIRRSSFIVIEANESSRQVQILFLPHGSVPDPRLTLIPVAITMQVNRRGYYVLNYRRACDPLCVESQATLGAPVLTEATEQEGLAALSRLRAVGFMRLP